MNASSCNHINCQSTKSLPMNGYVKILEIGPYPPPYDGWSSRIRVVKEGLEKAGHICVPLNLGLNRKIPSRDYECVRNGWEYLLKLIRYAFRGYKFHIHTNGDSPKAFLLNLIAIFISLLALRRPFLTFHAGTDQIYFPREKSPLMVPLFKILFGAAKAVICDNPDVARRIIDYGISPKKVFPISPFTKQYLEQPSKALDEDLERFLKSHTPVVLTYVECRPEYDLDSIFKVVGELARKMPSLGLIVVGATREREEISTMLHAAGLATSCLQMGVIEHAVFLALLQRVSVYLRSARTEGTCASIREALYFGTPVVANTAESHPQGVLTYTWGDAVTMFETLEMVLNKPNMRRVPKIQPTVLNVPDTVAEEVEVIVCNTLGKDICRFGIPASPSAD